MPGKREKFSCLSWQNVGNMTAKTLFSCNIAAAFFSLIIAKKCEAYDVMLKQSLVPDGQPLAIKCSLEKSLENGDYNLTWYKVGNQKPVPRDKLSRLHQQKDLIWFLPAMLEDSGDYECVIRNLTSFTKMRTKVTVFERIDGLCLNEKFAVKEVIFTSSSAKAVCPHLDFFRKEKNIHPVRWYKDCQLLEGKRFVVLNSDLIIFNVTVNDGGNYTCETTYIYNGKQYNISRDISLIVQLTPPKKPPEITYPRNNSIEVELGSQVTVDCNTTGADGYDVYWTGNDMSRIFASSYEGETSYDGRPMHSLKLIISEVSSEDYEQPFVCEASNAFGQVASYIILKHRVSDIRRWLTGGLVSLLILTFITLIIYKIFKIDLVLWYRNSICALTSEEDGKIYDAYVLYTESSEGRSICCLETFVHRILPDVLEKQCGYNLFILGRDDLPGEAVVSVADETLKQSRRLIIILGSETSRCCLLEDTSEQQLAMYNALIRDGIQVILIEMGEIQDYTNMPESVRYIKQKHGAVQWKGDFSEKSCSANTRFWKNVRYQMPSRKKVSYSEVHLLPLTSNSPAAKGS
ncbi:interleukin-1 receptor type 1-like isoform X1 [Catharus ustulatus]|uniref:Interleukin 1 receptor type 1 n=1 Tax=Catharus ustulatus TaxID=91951 RepID=A0A8C3V549_CATUS|nr:interleukin-1 receptor type 1-like isoform X1 [Catharus ustulatus]XP_032908839.1 interleukin-1 receptor type 1-like isoform X1 [Catharus ustulatus]XP_032908841.1 interleukin-1 receptor type 1-like isoform X1 [Catharus ustulatus]XP_032908842.1 interleukin-1 receptor type 1-like isoform X1 [Catharus ustulatus]